MSIDLEVLQAQVLRLPAAQRAQLLDRLIASLDTDLDAEAQWDALASKRDAQLESGEVAGVSLEAVIARLESRFSG